MNRQTCALRILAGGLFVVAGALKVRDPASFAASIDHYHLLPYFALAPLALYLPWLEIICGLAVIGSCVFRRSALVILCGMTVIFIVAVASAWLRGLDITCGCFGAASKIPLAYDLTMDVVLLIVLGWLLRVECRRATQDVPNAG